MAAESFEPTSADNSQERGDRVLSQDELANLLASVEPILFIKAMASLPPEWSDPAIDILQETIIQAARIPEDQRPSAIAVLTTIENTGTLEALVAVRDLLYTLRNINSESLPERDETLFAFAGQGKIRKETPVAAHALFSQAFPLHELSPQADTVISQTPVIVEPAQESSPDQRTMPTTIPFRANLIVQTILQRLRIEPTLNLKREEVIAASGLTNPDYNRLNKIITEAREQLRQLGIKLEKIPPFNRKRGDKTIFVVEPLSKSELQLQQEPAEEVSKEGVDEKKTSYDLVIFRNTLGVYRRLLKAVHRRDSQPVSPEQRISYQASLMVLEKFNLSVDDWELLGETFSVPLRTDESYSLASLSYVIAYLKTPRPKEVKQEAEVAASAFSLMKQWVQKKVEEIKEVRKPKEKQENSQTAEQNVLVEPEDTSLEIPEDESLSDYDESVQPAPEQEENEGEQENNDFRFPEHGENK
ncbi:hypothetical protein HY468_03360 [Candidatus Roizmanbacteria bacterium]|nr:hypothetical protein [Candidatus Roizmanbacteria bacterium]